MKMDVWKYLLGVCRDLYIVNDFLSLVEESMKHVYGEPLLWITMLLFLTVATYTDVKTLKIPNKLNGAFLIARLILIPFVGLAIGDVIGAILAGLALLIPAMVKMQKMAGDIKIAFVLGLYMGVALVPVFFVGASVMLALTTFISGYFGKKLILLPFAPFFLAMHVILGAVYFIFL